MGVSRNHEIIDLLHYAKNLERGRKEILSPSSIKGISKMILHRCHSRDFLVKEIRDSRKKAKRRMQRLL